MHFLKILVELNDLENILVNMARTQVIICYKLHRPSDYYNNSIWHCFRCGYSPDASGLQVNTDQAFRRQILTVKPYGGVSLSPANEAGLLWMQLFSEPRE